MLVERYLGQPLPIPLKFNKNPLTKYGKTYADIEDITMNFKIRKSTDLDDEHLEKLQSTGGVVLEEANDRFIMMLDNDYQNAVADKQYFLILAVKVVGIAEWIEIDTKDIKVKVTEDTNRK